MPRGDRGGLVGRAVDAIEARTGIAFEDRERLDYLEEAAEDRRVLRKELDLLAYTALDYFSGRPQELKADERWKLAQRSRVVWQKDPQAGAAVDLMNDFVFGRGVPKPKAKDPEVQKVIDEAWDDPANQQVLTSHQAQLALGTDLYLQSNLFVLLFDDGDDGKVRVSLLDHDSVRDVVEHPEDRFTVVWFVAKEIRREWDFKTDGPKQLTGEEAEKQTRTRYYQHWRNLDRLKEEEGGDGDIPMPPAAKIADGRVYHVAENRTSEMHFGHPRMDRILRWFSAYNRFMEARVDIMAATAAFVMKRKAQGSENQIARMATRAISRRSDLASAGMDEDPVPRGPRAGSVLNENESVTHEAFNLNSNAANAAQDARQLGAQISAATRWPRIYFGDAEAGGSLATATSLELPILKAVESRQELMEGIFRWFTDRAIERAVDVGRLNRELTDEERAARAEKDAKTGAPAGSGPPQLALVAAHEDKEEDEEITERDLSYEFSMPNPLRRAMGDLIGAVMNIARTFDPNNTNTELSRILLNVALSEGLELQDAAEAVERVFPPGYVDPAVAAAQAQGAPAAPEGEPEDDFGEFGPNAGAVGADGDRHTEDNPYGGPRRARPPEEVAQEAEYRVGTEHPDNTADPVALGDGRRDPAEVAVGVVETAFADLPEEDRAAAAERLARFDEEADVELAAATQRAMRRMRAGSASANGNGAGPIH